MALGLCAAGLAAPASGAPGASLVVVGPGNRFTDLWLTSSVVVSKRPTGLVTRRCGRYGGVYIQPLGSTNDVGFVDVARFDQRGLYYRQPIGLGLAAQGGIGDGTVRLPRGRYRVYLLGEGPACEVRLPVTRGWTRSAFLRPTEPFRVRYADAALDAARAGESSAGAAALPVAVNELTYVVGAVHYWTRSSGTSDAERFRHAAVCLDALPAGTCSPFRTTTDRVESYHGRRHPDGSTSTARTLFEYATPGTTAPGAYYAKASVAALSGEWTADAAVLAFDVWER